MGSSLMFAEVWDLLSRSRVGEVITNSCHEWGMQPHCCNGYVQSQGVMVELQMTLRDCSPGGK